MMFFLYRCYAWTTWNSTSAASTLFRSYSQTHQQVKTKEIVTVIELCIDCLRFYFSVYSLVLVSIEKIYQTLETVFHHISKHLEFRQKYSAARRIFKSLLGVWKCDETLPLAFDILHFKVPSKVYLS